MSTNGAVVVAQAVASGTERAIRAVDALRGVYARGLEGPADDGDGALGLGQVDADAHPRRARPPTAGSVKIGGTEITSLGDTDLTKLRREHIGFIFQFFNLLPMLNAEENILLPLTIAGEKVDKAWLEQLIELRRPAGPPDAPPLRALRRPAAARRDRPRAGLASRPSSSPTSRPATSTRRPAARSSSSCARPCRTPARRP